jgi:fluoride ion exporter CrcB/FEX
MWDEIFAGLIGAVIRWLLGKLFNSKRTFKSYCDEDSMTNTLIGICFWLILIVFFFSR